MIRNWWRKIKEKVKKRQPSHPDTKQIVQSSIEPQTLVLPSHVMSSVVGNPQSSVDDTGKSPATKSPTVTTSEQVTIPAADISLVPAQKPSPRSIAPSSLWSRAYEGLRDDDCRLVDKYERLLSKQIPADGTTGTIRSKTEPLWEAQTQEHLDDVINRIDAERDTRLKQLNNMLTQGLQQVDDKRMHYTIFGHEYTVKDQLAQAAKFIQAFKSLVDDAVKVSPEASLAWAGICVFLPLLTNPSAVEKENRDGLDYVNSRIRYYVEVEHLLWPDNLQCQGLKSKLESHIIDLYKHILAFQFKTALRLYRNQLARQGLDVIRYDNWENLLETVKDKEKIVERESKVANTISSRKELTAFRNAAETHYQDMQSLLQSILTIGKEQLQESKRTNQLIENQHPIDLPIVNNASYQSADVQGSPSCEEGTRLGIQEKITHWVDQEGGGPIFWLQGPAGTGKSTIARTVAHSLHRKKQLPAGYFFKRGEQGRNGTARLFPTIAMQMVNNVPSFRSCLRRYIENFDKDALESQALNFQFDQLLWKPLMDLPINNDIDQHHVIIIDALDECECESKDLSQILELLCGLHKLSTIHLRVLLTSRRTPQIEQAFKILQQGNPVCGLDLYRDFSEESRADIQIYLKNSFANIRTNAGVDRNPWPAPKVLDDLVQLATNPAPLFIYAATLCRFVYNEARPKDPRKQLKKWRAECNEHTSQLNQLYEPILRQAFSDDEDADPQLSFLRSLPLLATPLPKRSITSLLGIEMDDITWWLPTLYAVLDIPSEDDKPILLLHKSFSDFLLSPDNSSSQKYRVDPAETHAMLAAQCIKCMESGLKRDICNIQMAGTCRDQLESQTINDCIRADLKYACLYWVHHLQRSKQAMNDIAGTFLRTHFLHWLEVLSLLGELSSGVIAVRELSTMVKGEANAPPELVYFVNDAYRFILSQKGGIEIAPLQTYTSALIFSPTNSLIKKLFNKEFPIWVDLAPKVEADWNTCLQTLEGHSDWVNSVAFSPDGRRLASGSDDKTVKLWDAESGACLQTLEGHSGSVMSVAFSSDGRRLASGSSDKTVKLWDAESGAWEKTLEGHSDWVRSIAFSRKGGWLASGSQDNTVKLWDAESGACLRTLEGHSDWVRSVAFSSDSRRLASGSDDNTIKLWDAASGAWEKTLEGHSDKVRSVAFSSDSRRLASGSEDKTVKLWDAESGACLRTLEGHSYWVRSVAFSTDGRRLASGSDDNTIKLWDAASGACLQTLEGHSDELRSVAFSADGRRLASGSRDNTVKLWDAASGACLRTLESHSDEVYSVAFSTDSRQLASGSFDKAVKIWDAESGACLRTLESHSDCVRSVTFSSDGCRLASGSRDKTVRLWDAASGACLQTLEGHSDELRSVAFSADGRRLASGSEDKTVKIWDAESGACLQTLKGHSYWVISVAFSPDGRRLASGSNDNIVKLWDAESGACLQTLEGHSGSVSSVAFSTDGRRLASGSSDNTVKLWDAESGACLQTLNAGRPLQYLSFDPDHRSRLLSDAGDIGLDPSFMDTTPLTQGASLTNYNRSGYGISADNLWITYKGDNLIWLPSEYRPPQSRVIGSTIAIGCGSGRVWVIRFAGM